MSRDIRTELQEIFEVITSGNNAEALERCQARIDEAEEGPEAAPFMFMMGMIAYYNGDEGLGIQLLERAHAASPGCRDYAEALANMHTRLGHLADGLYYAKLTTVLRPNPDLEGLVPPEMASYRESLGIVGLSQHNMNAQTMFRLGRHAEAIAQAEQELRINPHNLDAMLLLAEALTVTGEACRAADILRAAVHLSPQSPAVHLGMASALTAAGHHADALYHLRAALDLGGRANREIMANAAANALYQPSATWPEARAILERFISDVETPRKASPLDGSPMGMIGILTDRCCHGPVVDFAQPAIKQINNTILYTLNIRKDIDTERFRTSVTRPRNAVGIDAPTLARIMIGDGLSVLINLCAPGPEAAFPTFKGANAPVGVNWITFPMCDRLPGTSLVVSGPETLDIDEANYGPENVVRLNKLVAYQFPQTVAPEEQLFPPPREELGVVTFGLGGDLNRLGPDTIEAVARVLWKTENSQLLLGGRDRWEDETVQHLSEAFARYGLANRLLFQRPVDIAGDPATIFFQQIDILLDTTPVSGDLDVVRSLFMGVPVVTLRGQRRAGRFAASILHAAGRAEWIAGSLEEYAAIASGLAGSPRLETLRMTLREETMASPLADVTDMARQLAEGIGQWVKTTQIEVTG